MATNTYTDTKKDRDHDGWPFAIVFFVFVLVSFIVFEMEIGVVPSNGELVVLGLVFVCLPLLFGLINAVQRHTYSSLGVGVSPISAWLIVTVGGVFVGTGTERS